MSMWDERGHENGLDGWTGRIFDLGFRAILLYLITALILTCVVAILFPDIWWLWSWTPSP